jgi:hypothetical protein
MAVTNGYVDLETLTTELQIGDNQDDVRLEQAIESASRQIDAHCGRVFWAEANAATRYYYPATSTDADVLDISTRTGLVVAIDTDDDGTFSTTLTETTDFLLGPPNAEHSTPARPWSSISMVGNYYFPQTRRPGLKVTAKHGYPAIPDAVVTACTIQARNLFKVSGAGVFGSVQMSVDGFALQIPALDYVAKGLLEPFRRMEV